MKQASIEVSDRTRELARQLRDCGDPAQARAIRDEMFELNTPLVRHLISPMVIDHVRKNPDLFDNLLAGGYEGLVKAIDRYDPEKGRWSSFARLYIKQAVSETVRRAEYPDMSKHHFERRQPILREAEKYEQPSGHIDEIVTALQKRYPDQTHRFTTRAVTAVVSYTHPSSTDAPTSVEVSGSASLRSLSTELQDFVDVDDTPVSVEDQALAGATRDEYRRVTEAVLRALDDLPENQRDAIVGYYLEGRSSGELGDKHGMASNTMRLRKARGLEKLRERFTTRDMETVRLHLEAV